MTGRGSPNAQPRIPEASKQVVVQIRVPLTFVYAWLPKLGSLFGSAESYGALVERTPVQRTTHVSTKFTPSPCTKQQAPCLEVTLALVVTSLCTEKLLAKVLAYWFYTYWIMGLSKLGLSIR